MKVGILTSGGDCQGLNAVIRGICKYLFENFKDIKIIGFLDGYKGLMSNESTEITAEIIDNILNMGGTILRSSRQPFKKLSENKDNQIDKMIQTYQKEKLDCLFVLGGAGSHKTANLLSISGVNIIGLPKTIDNDIWGTDVTFGFHTAVDIATDCIERVKSTAASHSRVMLVELMGNKAGWLTLYAGIAGGADVILIPEMPFFTEKIIDKINDNNSKGKFFTIIAIAEGAVTIEESFLSKNEKERLRAETTISNALAKIIGEKTGIETRVVVPGHIQRGGDPSAYDKILSTQMGYYAGKLFEEKKFGVTVAMCNNKLTYNALNEIAGKSKLVPQDHYFVKLAQKSGISFGIMKEENI